MTSTSAEQTEAIRQSMQDEKAMRDELVRELSEARAEIERLQKEADGQFVEAAIRVMRANPGFDARDYAEDGITADDFEMFFTEDMNEAWRFYEREKATKDELVRELVEALKEYIIAFGYPCLNEKMDEAKRKAHAALRKAGAL